MNGINGHLAIDNVMAPFLNRDVAREFETAARTIRDDAVVENTSVWASILLSVHLP